MGRTPGQKLALEMLKETEAGATRLDIAATHGIGDSSLFSTALREIFDVSQSGSSAQSSRLTGLDPNRPYPIEPDHARKRAFFSGKSGP
jgi:hypothetical protein